MAQRIMTSAAPSLSGLGDASWVGASVALQVVAVTVRVVVVRAFAGTG